MMHVKICKWLVSLAVAASLVLLGWLGREAVGFKAVSKAKRGAEAPSVSLTVATNAVFNPPVEYVGHVEPAQVTDILPQIDGYIRRVCFTEGAKVEEGDLLFEIDDEQYTAAKNLRYSEVASAEAKVTVALAEVDRAERYFNRLASAGELGVSATERDTAETALASAKAALNAANAAVGQAKASAAIADFNLRHTKILSPISGRIGKALRHVGDYVSPSKSALARVVQIDPIRVVFPVSDRDYDAWQAAAERGGRALKDSRRLRLTLPDGSMYGAEGDIDFGDNEMSRETATLTMHVRFPNPSGRLVPNAYVRVLSDEKNPPPALVVPTAALVRADDGLQAWKLSPDGTAHPVAVVIDGEWNGLSRVASGLSEGDEIVSVGAFKLNDGDAVRVVGR
jgi:membrane fusion protein (multidrug efflux system)